MRPYEIDVPVKLMIWTRPEAQKRQFEVVRKAAPSVLFLISDGGRNDWEKEQIRKSRAVFDDIDWDCTVYRLYFEENQGMYHMQSHMKEFIWSRVDRCIMLEDDLIPAVSFFRFCAELLEKYKDDQRIQMICGNNVFDEYPDAMPNDYFFAQVGWSIWGYATWKRTVDEFVCPLPYQDDAYVRRCLRDNTTKFWMKKADAYCSGRMADGHVPGTEYFLGINGALQHRLNIIPTRNMISNIGMEGTHSDRSYARLFGTDKLFHLPVHEVGQTIHHPGYVIDDRAFGKKYEKRLGHHTNIFKLAALKFIRIFQLVREGKLLEKLREKFSRKLEK